MFQAVWKAPSQRKAELLLGLMQYHLIEVAKFNMIFETTLGGLPSRTIGDVPPPPYGGVSPPYIPMPQESLDDGGAVGADEEGPVVQWSSEILGEKKVEVTGVKPKMEDDLPKSRQLPPQSTSVSSEEPSISGRIPPQRAVPGVVWNDGERRDPIIFSCFAPPAVQPGISFSLKVKAYLRRARDAVLREALSEGAAETGGAEGMSIAKGSRVTVKLVRRFERKRRIAIQ